MAEWISVKERLPEKSGSYLVCYKTGVVKIITYFTGTIAPNHETWCEDGPGFYILINKVGYNISDSVTHWMPLPEPPKVLL